MALASILSALRQTCEAQFERLRHAYDSDANGRAVLALRSDIVDELILRLHAELFPPADDGPADYCLLALGGYGRRELFPYSDVDLLFLYRDRKVEEQFRDCARELSKHLWDFRLRLSPSTRTLAECDELRPDSVEFSISLLDCRCLAGDVELYRMLRGKTLPGMIIREHRDLVSHIAFLTQQRHAKYGHTIFHLEPNTKDAPGGLRDYHVARWLAGIAAVERGSLRIAGPDVLREELGADSSRAFDFLSTVRCYLHLQQGRDDNILTYERQAELAARGIGVQSRQGIPPEDWMREYFRHARVLERLAGEWLEEVPAATSTLYERFEDWRSRLSTEDFYVSHGRILTRKSGALEDPHVMFGLFKLVARHGLGIGAETEKAVEQALPSFRERIGRWPDLWALLCSLLDLPYAADALRAMNRLGVLAALLPEFSRVDALVVRDFYHRYTVDEHTFRTIEHLHHLRKPRRDWQKRFADLFVAIEHREWLFFALLYHDVGKGTDDENHVRASLAAVRKAFVRFAPDSVARSTVKFLIESHLEMSATLLRRDIFDPEIIRGLAEKVGTTQRLRMLTLLTYADIHSVNPEALTPWKAEMLWQLYAATENYLTRSADDDRLHTVEADHGQAIASALGVSGSSGELGGFLEGFPRRYLLLHSPEEVRAHFEMAQAVGESGARLQLAERGHSFELTVVTLDRAGLFARIVGSLTAQGMNIVRAEAFANRAGMVVDVFQFADIFRTLELNPSEREGFVRRVSDAVTSTTDLRTLVEQRTTPWAPATTKLEVATWVRLDNEASAHSTLLELVAQDHSGLLYEVISLFADLGCNIEVALIDTEGPKAVDTFYLTVGGAKLDAALQQQLRDALLGRLGNSR